MKIIILLLTFICIISSKEVIKYESTDATCRNITQVSIFTPKCTNSTIGYITTKCNETHIIKNYCPNQKCNENCIEFGTLPVGKCFTGKDGSSSYGCGSYKYKREGSATTVFYDDKKCQIRSGKRSISEGCHLEDGYAVTLSCTRSFFYPLGYFSKITYNGTKCEGEVLRLTEIKRGECLSEGDVNYMITSCNTTPVDQILVIIVALAAILIGCFGFFSFSIFFAFLSSKLKSMDTAPSYDEIK